MISSFLPRAILRVTLFCILTLSAAHARPPLFLLDGARLAEVRILVTVPGTTHHEAYEAMKARVDANNIPGTASDIRGDFAREAAMVYLITGNPVYADAAFQRLEEIYTISVPAGRDAPDVGNGLARAQGIASFSVAYNWAYDAWTPEQRAWVWGVLEKALNEYESQALSHPNIGYQQNNSNWSGVVAGAHVTTLIALDLQNVRRFDYQRSRELLRTHLASFGGRGWTQEGNYYFVLSLEYVLPAMMALRQVNDPHVEPSFASRRPHHITMYAGMFNAAQNTLTWGVGGDSLPPYGMTSALLSLVPEGEKGFYRWFYDRYRGIDNPAPAAQKYDHAKAGTPYVLIGYPNNIAPQNPTGHFPTVMHDNLGGYVLRSGWNGEDDTVVGLWSDTNNYGRSWNQRDAGLINILSHGAKWGHGPGPATTGLDASFSQILVNGVARANSGQGTNLGHEVAPNGGYARVGGGSKFANLDVHDAARHVLADFSPEDFSIISTFDRLRSNETQTYGWNLYLPGRTVTIGTDMVNDVDFFHVTDSNGAYLRAWFIVHGNGFITDNQAVRYEYDGADADIWVVMAAGRGTPPEISVSGLGLDATVTLGGSVLTFDGAAQRIRSSTLTDLNSTVNPTLSASPTTGPAPLSVNFSGSGTADPGETLAYSWDFGDGSTSTAQSSTHTYANEGIYLASLGVADGQGGSDRILRDIFVGNREPTARITASQTIVLPGGPVSLSGSTSTDPEGGPLIYEWDLGDGRVMTGETIEVSWPVESVFRVFLKVTDSGGLINVARVMIRVENQPPVSSFVTDTLGGFVPFEVNFDGSASYDPEGEALLYRWNFDDGTVVDTTSPSIAHTFTLAKNHTVRLTVFDPEGKSGTTTRIINALGSGDILPAEPDPGNLAQGLNYQVYRGDPTSGANLPEISTLRPLNNGRVPHYDHDVTELTSRYVVVFEGYLLAPETGVYGFRMRTHQQSHVYIGGLRVLRSNSAHSAVYEEIVALEAGLHRYRIEINHSPIESLTWPNYSLLWSLPSEEGYRVIPQGQLFSPPALFLPTLRVTPTSVYDGGTVMFESTAISPDGEPLSYLWDFGDGNTSTEARVAHTYVLASNLDYKTFNAKLTVTDSTGNAFTVGEQITVSRLAGLVMRIFDEIRRDRWIFDQRTVSRDITEAVNHALEPGTSFTFSSELRSDLGGALLVDDNHNTRWVSAQPEDWVRFSFAGKDGSPKRYNITEYSFTAGALGWTTHRDPKDWEVYGSNHSDPAPFLMEPGASNPDWFLIDAVTGQSGELRLFPTIYSLPNDEAYAHYLFHLRNQSGGVEGELELTEIQIFSYFEHDPQIDGNQAPIPSLIASATEIEVNLPIEFDASGTVDPDGDWLYYTWDFGDGHILRNRVEGDLKTHTYYHPGTYTATLSITDARGLSAEITETISVLPPQPNTLPVPLFSATSETVLVGTEITFDAGASYDPDGDALHYHWEFGDGRHAEGPVVTHTYDRPGHFSPLLILTDARGLKSPAFLDIEILPPNSGRGIISFNFAQTIGQRRASLNPYRGAGVLPVAFWNDHLPEPWMPAFYDSRGQPVDVTLTRDESSNQRSIITHPIFEFDGNSQLTANSIGKSSLDGDYTWFVNNVPYDVYDVFVYFSGSHQSNARVVFLNSEPRYVIKSGHGYTGQWIVTEAATAAEVVPGGDVLLWRNVSGSSFEIEMITRDYDTIAGFQIVDKTGSPDAPPVVEILSPETGDWFFAGEPVTLAGIARMGDDPLADPFIRWDSDRDGFLGNGASLTTSTLSVGTHTLSLTGINEGDLSMAASVIIDIFAVPAAPTIVTQPTSLTTYETATIGFSVAATGSPPLFSYQWRKDGEALADDARISGATTDTLSIAGVTFADAGNYDVVVTNDMGSTPSALAQLVVTELIAPSVGTAPAGGIIDRGGEIVLSADIVGSRPMQFQWYFNGEVLEDNDRISGATSETLTLANAHPDDAGLYELIATNAGGDISTSEVEIVINLPPVITLVRPLGAAAEIPLGTGAWLRTEIADNTVDPAAVQLTWTQLDGPGDVSFTDPFAVETGVTFPSAGEYRVSLTAFDGSFSSSMEVVLTVRSDLDGVTAPVGDPMINDTFDWGPVNLSHSQTPADSGWRMGTGNFSYAATADGTWSGAGYNPYVIFGDTVGGGVLRGNIGAGTRGVQRDFPASGGGQRWISLLLRLNSGFETAGHQAIFSIGGTDSPNYSWGIPRERGGFGFRQSGSLLSLVAMEEMAIVSTTDVPVPLETWLLVIAKTTVDPDGPDSLSVWILTADDDFSLTESSLGEPRLTYTGFDWGAGITNLWVGGQNSTTPRPNFDVDELRVSTEGGDRGLGQVIAELDAGIQIGPEVTIAAPGPVQPGEPVALVGQATDPDSHPDPLTVQWGTASGPASALFADPTDPATDVTFPVGGTYVLRLIADDGAVATFAERALTVGSVGDGFSAWMDTYAADIPADRRAPLADASGDGLANLLAYARGLDPRHAHHGTTRDAVHVQRDGNDLVVTLWIPEALDRPDLHYRVLQSTNLTDWSPIAEALGSTEFTPLGINAPLITREADTLHLRLSTAEGYFLLEITLLD